jgi:prefoldin subunit 5
MDNTDNVEILNKKMKKLQKIIKKLNKKIKNLEENLEDVRCTAENALEKNYQ